MADSGPELKRELGLRDLTLFAIACIVGSRWIPAAAHAGPGSVTLWLLAAVMFMVPLAIAVAALSAKYPGTGGFYLWIVRNDFGRWHGFLAFVVYWISIAFWFPSAAMFYMSAGAYALGPSYAYLANSRPWVLTASLIAIWIALGTNIVGMKIGKWTQNIGAACILGARRAPGGGRRHPVGPERLGHSAEFRAQMELGHDQLLVHHRLRHERPGNACPHGRRDPQSRPHPAARRLACLRDQHRLLRLYHRRSPGDPASRKNQRAERPRRNRRAGRRRAAHRLAVSPHRRSRHDQRVIGQFGGLGTAVSRLPFAVGVDQLLPAAFGKVHPRWGTPHISILALGLLASFLLIAIQLGDTMRAAYQALVSLMVINGFLPYLYIFGSAWKAGKRLSALSGWAITLLAILCSVVPTAEVTNVWLFETKLVVGTLAVIVTAWLLYRRVQHLPK